MIDDLNYHYTELMREAYELETIAADLDTIMERIAILKKELALYSHNLPYKLLEVFGLKYTY